MKRLIVIACFAGLAACGGRNASVGSYVPQMIAPTAHTPQDAESLASDAKSHAPHFAIYHVPATVNGYHPCCPYLMTVDPKTDNLWWGCSSACGGIIVETTTSGKFPFAITPFYKGTIFGTLLKKFEDEPSFMTIGADGALWFLDSEVKNPGKGVNNATAAIGRLDIADPIGGPSSFEGWTLPKTGYVGVAIAATSHAVWFTSGVRWSNKLGWTSPTVFSITTASGRIVHHRDGWGALKDAAVSYNSMIPGENGSIWMGWTPAAPCKQVQPGVYKCPPEDSQSYMDEWLRSGAFHQFKLPLNTDMLSPALGSDGAIWYQARQRGCANDTSGVIGRIDASGKVNEYCLRENLGNGHWRTFGDGYALAAGSDGNIWFVAENGGLDGASCHVTARNTCLYLARIDPRTKKITEYKMPESIKAPEAMAAGSQHDLWIADEQGDNIVRVGI